MHVRACHICSELVRLLQIWIIPERRGIKPSYEQKSFPAQERRGRLRLVASPDGEDASVTVHQDVRVYAALLGEGEKVRHRLAPDRHAWLQVARGKLRVAGTELVEGDGAAISGEASVELHGIQDAEVLFFDLN